MDQSLFTGSGVAMVTPFLNGEVDFKALGRMIERQISQGTDALVVCGTTGEPPTLTEEEKERIIAFSVERAAGRIPVIAGTGCNNTAASVRQSIRARELGADGLLVVTPYYNKTTQRGLVEHYTAIADAAQLPVILYNVPSRTGMNLLPETAARLAEHPMIRGVKEAGGDISQIAELARLAGDRIALYSGHDDQVLPMLALGGQGVISVAANVVPTIMHELVAAWFAGDIARSRALQFAVNPLCRQLFSEVNPIPVKAALALMGLCRADVRPPLTNISPEHLDALRRQELIVPPPEHTDASRS